MAGHSKWSTIKRKKGAIDAKRGKIFTKLIKEITLAARLGGGDAEGNPRLRQAILAAKAENMPKDNIDKAIKKGTGELGGAEAYEEVVYEGYGPGGVAVLVEVMTENKNRTVAEVRHIFSKHGGNLGKNGCVAPLFDRKGDLIVSKDIVDEDRLMEIVLEAGAEDVKDQGTELEIITAPDDFEAVREAIEGAGISCLVAEIAMVPQTTVPLADEQKATQMLKLMEKMEDNDDVQNVYANFDISDDLMERLG